MDHKRNFFPHNVPSQQYNNMVFPNSTLSGRRQDFNGISSQLMNMSINSSGSSSNSSCSHFNTNNQTPSSSYHTTSSANRLGEFSVNVNNGRRTRRRSHGRKYKEKMSKRGNRNNANIEELDESIICAFKNYESEMKIKAVYNQTSAKAFRVIQPGECRHINNQFDNNYFQSILNRYVLTAFNNTRILYGQTFNNGISSDRISNCSIAFGQNKSSTKNVSRVSNLQNTRSNLVKNRRKVKKTKEFPSYWKLEDVEHGLRSGMVIKGIIRINAKSPNESYVSHEDSTQQDYLIQTHLERNRALEGDVVAICLKSPDEWTEKLKTAVVVYIYEQVHSRTSIGLLQSPSGENAFRIFIPRDCRFPRLKIPMDCCPDYLNQNFSLDKNMLFKAKIAYWSSIDDALGFILEKIGPLGDIEAETMALLAEHCLDITPFPPEMLEQSGIKLDETIPSKEFTYREDLRKECIFTIDPLTARDLDDAMSCKELPNGNLEVGVHISDVAFYLKDETPLNDMVSKKATTIYLVNNVYHMLPRELTMHCSLLPGQDKLAFSVFWEMTKDGAVINKRISRTVINSCAQLSYEHAQVMIEDPYCKGDKTFPEISGNFTYEDISKRVNCLQKIAVNLRQKRFENGSLRINQTKLLFRLDSDTHFPTDVFVYENKEAHRLIEEFMLLANMCVAETILEKFPKIAFLRKHCPPNANMIKDLVKTLQQYNLHLDTSTSKSMQRSLLDIQKKFSCEHGMLAVYHMLAKPMKRADYFCAFETENRTVFRHFALSVPLYTHFTSPIRRYADIMVHRLLSATLGYEDAPKWTPAHVKSIAEICNTQKYNAKLAGDSSSELFLSKYVIANQPFIRTAIIVDIKATSFEILVVETGTICRINLNNLNGNVTCKEEQQSNSSKKQYVLVFSKNTTDKPQVIPLQLFTLMEVSLHPLPQSNKLEVQLVGPVKL